MKTILFLFAVLIFGLVSCNNATSNRSVEINGVRWATRNIDTPGNFARNPESAGGFFTFEEAQNACPRGWRLPTGAELESLRNAAGGEWTAMSGVNGRTFGIEPNRVFLPAAGLRVMSGSLSNVGTNGFYWSSSPSTGTTSAMYLFFRQDVSSVGHARHTDGMSVRCVAE